MEPWRHTLAFVIVRGAAKSETGDDSQGIALPARARARDNIGAHKRTAARGGRGIRLI
jgi:hypothetical protein